MMCRKTMDIVLASDENYMECATICIASLFAFEPHQNINIHLLANDVTRQAIDILSAVIPTATGHLYIYPIENLRERLTVKVPETISVTSYARLFAESILPASIDKVLYIDCDIIFNGKIDGLFDMNLGNSLVGGVLDPLLSRTYKKEINISEDEPYINAGILLIPLKRWRDEHIEQRFVDFLVANRGKVHHHDQGIINAVCKGKKTILPPQFNVMSNSICYPWKCLNIINEPFYQKSEFEKGISNPTIIHYTGAIFGRPWIEGCTHPYANKFLKFKAKTAYKDMPLKPNNQSFLHKMEGIAYHYLPFGIFKVYMQTIYKLSYIKHKIKKLFL